MKQFRDSLGEFISKTLLLYIYLLNHFIYLLFIFIF
nr:MAG TPA: hypothetical protein [Caudoviricetes sp.]